MQLMWPIYLSGSLLDSLKSTYIESNHPFLLELALDGKRYFTLMRGFCQFLTSLAVKKLRRALNPSNCFHNLYILFLSHKERKSIGFGGLQIIFSACWVFYGIFDFFYKSGKGDLKNHKFPYNFSSECPLVGLNG